MKNKSRKHLFARLALGLTVLLANSTASAQSDQPLNKRQAVDFAELFLETHGYTDITGIDKPRHYHLEPGEDIADLDKILAARANSITSKAVRAHVNKVNGESVWSVQFLLKRQEIGGEYCLGREVRMTLSGRRIWIERGSIPIKKAHRLGGCLGENDKRKKP